jgi:hypothetical protein
MFAEAKENYFFLKKNFLKEKKSINSTINTTMPNAMLFRLSNFSSSFFDIGGGGAFFELANSPIKYFVVYEPKLERSILLNNINIF